MNFAAALIFIFPAIFSVGKSSEVNGFDVISYNTTSNAGPGSLEAEVGLFAPRRPLVVPLELK